MDKRKIFNIIKRPIITDKTTKYLEDNKYCFAVTKNTNKTEIKKAIEYIFNVKVKNINTLNMPLKKRSIGKFTGNIATYKKAIIQLHDTYNINLFAES
uniref:Large ribosomal subunit protein uL23c n=1 Tax=Callithamnion tetricum TaxID=193179 RepID=A0A4D6WR53_9FLOR|nr:ribosomal protein L23 [Callithamnion tetricum]